ncbi:MAG: adenylosuccinate synthase [Capsulimonadaceae bacterium]|nr:adenylosuccinate synthase [Capsulimonadaceae bacterium]
MANTVVVGAQWGDEAKGKIIDCLAHDKDLVVRWGGGSNAGHTVCVGDQEYKLHLVPAGILNGNTLNVVADGVVIDPAGIVEELTSLKARGVSCTNLKISGNAHVILPYHRLFDQLEEKRKGEKAIGTTGRGIGPAYQDKAARIGIRMRDFCDPKIFPVRLAQILDIKNEILVKLYGVEPLVADQIVEQYREFALFLKPYVDDTALVVARAAKSGKSVLFEGAQGTLLDIDLGTYPYVTSSHPSAGGATIGTGLGPTQIDQIIGVAKSYTTRVGAGAFPTELLDDTGNLIRERGREYGTTTGRPRRCGWLDGVALHYASLVNGLTSLSLMHLDVLSGFDEVKICMQYSFDGRSIEDFPSDQERLSRCTPIYKTLQGWKDDVSEAKTYDELPENVKKFVETVEKVAGVPVTILSVGRRRDQTIFRPYSKKISGSPSLS